MTKLDWDKYIQSLDECAEKHGGCDGCPRYHLCLRQFNSKNDKFRSYNCNHVVFKNRSEDNPCVTDYNINLPHGMRLKPLSMSDCVGFAAVGDGHWRPENK